MALLTPPQRRALRAKAHHLQPVVSIGQHGLTPGVLHEIDVNLRAHELIKVRVFGDDRVRREAMLERICTELDAAAVQHLGKLLIIWRPAPEASPRAEASPQVDHATEAPTRRSGKRVVPKGTQEAKSSQRTSRDRTSRDRASRTPDVGTPARGKTVTRTLGSSAGRGQPAHAYRMEIDTRMKRAPQSKRGTMQPRGDPAMAKSTPQARRPRTPMARAPERPPRTGRGINAQAPKPVTGKGHRRRGGSA